MSSGRWGRGRAAASALALAAALLGGGCTTLDNLIGSFPWFTTMRDQPSIQAYEMPRASPPGSVPTTGREDSLDLLGDLREVASPIARTDSTEARGKVLFQTYCEVCHGPAGRGDGPTVPTFLPPPDLTLDASKKRSDGYLFAIIRQGRGVMPGYGDRVRGLDRWRLVHYLRALQVQ